MKEKKETFVRINSRVSKDQFQFIKNYAKKNKMTEGEAHRYIINYFITNI